MGGDRDVRTTVLIPVWDEYASWLTQAVASVEAQNVATRILVVDNASEVAVPRARGVCVVNTGRRLTLGAARNLGLAQVDTPYVVVWDADDTMLPGTLGFLEDAIRSDTSLAAFGTAIVEQPSGRRHRWPRPWVAVLVRHSALFSLLNCVWSLYPTTGATIMRTDLMRSAGGYSDAESGDDWCLGVSLAFRGRIGWSERPGRTYRLHPRSIRARYMTVRHLLRHARVVRERIRQDPGIAGWARAALPAIMAAQYASVLAHVGLSAARSLRHALTAAVARKA
jgi:glycosyltransferase involved in cell wall biosynthesis